MASFPTTYSDSLPHLEQIIQKIPSLAHIAGTVLHVPVIVDANVMARTLLHKVRHPDRGRPALEECVSAGVIGLHAPACLDYELVHRAIPKISGNTRVSEQDMLDAWEEFSQYVTLYNVSRASLDSVAPSADTDDIPYVALEYELQAAGTLSEDRDVSQLGGNAMPLDFVLSLRGYARSSADAISIRLIGFGGFVTTIALSAAIVRGFHSVYRRAPKACFAVAAGFLLVIFLFPSLRNRLMNMGQDGKELFESLLPVIDELFHEFDEKTKKEKESRLEAEQYCKI